MRGKKILVILMGLIFLTGGLCMADRNWGICPKCKKVTQIRQGVSSTATTLVSYSPIYDKEGNNINPNRNTTTTGYECLECGTTFVEKN